MIRSYTLAMESRIDLFAKFGGTRPMARALGSNPGTVHSWKRARRIPAGWQPTILARAAELRIDVSAEDVMFPFPEDRAVR